MVNELVNERRRGWWRFERPGEYLPDSASASSEAGDVDPELARALSELPPRMRAAIVFRFFVQAQNEYELVLAPRRAMSPGPGDDPTADLFDPRVYTGKIAVYLQNKDYMVDPVGDEQLTIAGKAAAIRTAPGATQIFVVQSPRVYLTVQFDDSLGLTRDQTIEVAGGVSLTPAAVAEAEKAYAKPLPSKVR